VNCPVLLARDLSGFRTVAIAGGGSGRRCCKGTADAFGKGSSGGMSGAKPSVEEAAEILGSRSGRSGVSAIGVSGRRPHQREREMGQIQQMTR
jgi:hypothetical protein